MYKIPLILFIFGFTSLGWCVEANFFDALDMNDNQIINVSSPVYNSTGSEGINQAYFTNNTNKFDVKIGTSTKFTTSMTLSTIDSVVFSNTVDKAKVVFQYGHLYVGNTSTGTICLIQMEYSSNNFLTYTVLANTLIEMTAANFEYQCHLTSPQIFTESEVGSLNQIRYRWATFGGILYNKFDIGDFGNLYPRQFIEVEMPLTNVEFLP